MPKVSKLDPWEIISPDYINTDPIKELPRAMKPKKANKGGAMDKCQSPPEVILPLLDFIPKDAIIWESAAGEGNLVNAFVKAGYQTVSSDIESNQDFYTYNPIKWNIQVTNPPYGNKPKWTKRSYELGKPFALLMPLEFWGTTRLHVLWKKYGMMQQIVFTNPARINFKMPNKGWEGQAQFPTMWFTYGLNQPKDTMVWDYTERTWYL